MDCPSFEDLKLDSHGRNAIDDIKSVYDFSSVISPIMAAGTFLNIFLGNGFIEVSYSIYSTDFQVLGQAMKQIPAVSRNRIELIATQAALFSSPNWQQEQFFRAIANGCTLR